MMGWVWCRAVPKRVRPFASLHHLSTISSSTNWSQPCGSRSAGIGQPQWGTTVLVGQHLQSSSINGGMLCRFVSMKSKVDRRKLAIRDLKLVRKRAKLRKAQMTEEELLSWRLEKAKRKAALLEQRLRKFVLPDDPEPLHDPELITPEQHQSLKKIGYKNRNYVPVGRRGVYGGVVQNMHMHWKKHETVQVDCQNYKRSVVKQMAKDLARLSGGIVIDIHQKRLIIMYRGRNYRQPKGEMIPGNTLTKRKALFKSKYDQALEMVQMNISDIENKLKIILKRKAAGGSPVHLESSLSASSNTINKESVQGRYGMVPMEDEYIGRQSEVSVDEDSDWEVISDSESADDSDVDKRIDKKQIRGNSSSMDDEEDDDDDAADDDDSDGGGDDDDDDDDDNDDDADDDNDSINYRTLEERKGKAFTECYAEADDVNRSALKLELPASQHQQLKPEQMDERIRVNMIHEAKNDETIGSTKQQQNQDVSIEGELSYFSDFDEFENWEESEGDFSSETRRVRVQSKKGSAKASIRKEPRKNIKAQALHSDFSFPQNEAEWEQEKCNDFEGTNPDKGEKVDARTRKEHRIADSEDEFVCDSSDGDQFWKENTSDEDAVHNHVAVSKSSSQSRERMEEVDLWFGDSESDISDELEKPDMARTIKEDNTHSKNKKWHHKLSNNNWKTRTSSKALKRKGSDNSDG